MGQYLGPLRSNSTVPTQTQNKEFYPLLKQKVESIGISKFIMMGDLSCLTCDLPINCNTILNKYEFLNVSAILNLSHTKTLVECIRDGFIVDKSKLLYLNIKIFSYIPFSEQAIKRSWIDHCLAKSNNNKKNIPIDFPSTLIMNLLIKLTINILISSLIKNIYLSHRIIDSFPRISK